MINPNKIEVLLFCKASSRAFLEGVMKLRLDGTTLGLSKGATNLGLFIDVNLRLKDKNSYKPDNILSRNSVRGHS